MNIVFRLKFSFILIFCRDSPSFDPAQYGELVEPYDCPFLFGQGQALSLRFLSVLLSRLEGKAGMLFHSSGIKPDVTNCIYGIITDDALHIFATSSLLRATCLNSSFTQIGSLDSNNYSQRCGDRAQTDPDQNPSSGGHAGDV